MPRLLTSSPAVTTGAPSAAKLTVLALAAGARMPSAASAIRIVFFMQRTVASGCCPGLAASLPAMSRTAPWADEPARSRLAAVEAGLPSDALAALGVAARSAREHARAIDEECLLLYAGGNVPSPLVASLHEAALMSQPSMGYPGDKYQPGLERIDVVEVAAAEAVARVMGARFAEVRSTSATLANLAVYTALASPGDTIAVLPGWAGGHLSHHAIGAPGVRGLRVVELPYDDARLD